jgi:hypothetical protein
VFTILGKEGKRFFILGWKSFYQNPQSHFVIDDKKGVSSQNLVKKPNFVPLPFPFPKNFVGPIPKKLRFLGNKRDVVFETKFCSLAFPKIECKHSILGRQCFHVPKKQVFLGRHHEVGPKIWFLKPNFGKGKQKGMGPISFFFKSHRSKKFLFSE